MADSVLRSNVAAREITVSKAKLGGHGFPEKIVLRKTREIAMSIENLGVRSRDIRVRHGN
jgi:hypothetical protein